MTLKLQKFLFLAFAFLGISTVGKAIDVTPQNGKVYRIINASKEVAICEDYSAHTLYCGSVGDITRYDQMWKLTTKGSGFSIQNVYTGQYVQTQPSATYSLFKTGTTEIAYYFNVNSSQSSYYNISSNSGTSNWVMHCQADNAVVGWYPTSSTLSASEWYLQEVSISDETISLARLQYQENANIMGRADEIKSAVTTFFTDNACTQLKSEYAAMSDADLRTAMSALPTALQDAAVKIKNNSWGHREQEFRVRSYEPYSDADTWGTTLMTKKYSYLDNPTGIYGKAATLLYVFVDADCPSDATLSIMGVTDTNVSGAKTTLKKGLNIIQVSKDMAMQFVLYTANTAGTKVIADFPNIKIHIEGGVVNGFFDSKVHTDADWVDISQNLATHDIIQVKGEKMIFHMERSYVTASNCCPSKISDAIGWWDNMARWEQSLMGIDDVCPSKFNNHLCAITLTSGYESATDYRTQYLNSYITNLLPLANVLSNADNAWGPGHENGHVHQNAINMVGCSEISNNLFSNYVVYNLGKYMSRGASIKEIAAECNSNTPWLNRSGWTKLRMYWQLAIYYQILGKNPNFYPTLFKLMRATPLARNTNNTGMQDQLLFAEKCCEAAGQDLSSFFEAWGFFKPITNGFVGDYGNYYLTVTDKEIADAKAFMAKYPKAAPIEFIEDRVKYVERTDGVSGHKLTNDLAVGSAGDMGHYTDFADSSVIASGYVYAQTGTSVKISDGTGAVGFRVYDSEGNLLSFSNCLSFSIPESAIGKTLVFKAVQVNNQEVTITTAAEGTEAQQLAALNTALSAAKTYVNLSNSTGTKVGYYYANAIADLKAVYDSASTAKTNADQTVRTYGQWSILLNNEIEKLMANSSSKITIKEKNYYSLLNYQYSGYGISLSGNSLVCNTNSSVKNTDPRKKWEFVSTGTAGTYYVKNKGGNYITVLKQSAQGSASTTEKSAALAFQVVDNGDGTFYLKAQDDAAQCMHCDASKNLVGWDSSASASHWYITLTEDNATEYQLAMLDSLIKVAGTILNEVTDTTAITAGNITLYSNVVAKTTTFAADINSLYTTRLAGMAAYGKLQDYTATNESLESAIAAVQGQYNLVPSMPQASSESEVTWYYIKSVDKSLYCGIDTTSSRYLNYITLTDPAKDNRYYWWCFVPTGNNNEFYLYNCRTGADVYYISNGSLKSDKEKLGTAFTLALDSAKFAFTIKGGDYLWYASTYAKVGKVSGYWLFEKILTEANNCLTGVKEIENDSAVAKDNVYYDLFGRKVEHPAKGLYIYNGKKIFIK